MNAFAVVWRSAYVRVLVYALVAVAAYLLLSEISSVLLLAGLAPVALVSTVALLRGYRLHLKVWRPRRGGHDADH